MMGSRMEEKPKFVVVPTTRKRQIDPAANLAEHRASGKRKISPCAYQTQEQIEAYYRKVSKGAVAVVRQTQHYMLIYSVTEVEYVTPHTGRLCVTYHGLFFMKSGKNCHHPTGKTTLVVPTREVLKWAEAHPRGELDWSCFPPEQSPVGFL